MRICVNAGINDEPYFPPGFYRVKTDVEEGEGGGDDAELNQQFADVQVLGEDDSETEGPAMNNIYMDNIVLDILMETYTRYYGLMS